MIYHNRKLIITVSREEYKHGKTKVYSTKDEYELKLDAVRHKTGLREEQDTIKGL